MPIIDLGKGRCMAADRQQDTVSSYDEYLRRYPHPYAESDLRQVPNDDDIAAEAERHGRRILRQAAASLAAQTQPAPKRRHR
jgi:hypothetical protein